MSHTHCFVVVDGHEACEGKTCHVLDYRCEYNYPLRLRLEGFANRMLEKFMKVADKYGGMMDPRSVTSEWFKWDSVEAYDKVKRHLLQEIEEWKTDGKPSELIDIANCAFALHEILKELKMA